MIVNPLDGVVNRILRNANSSSIVARAARSETARTFGSLPSSAATNGCTTNNTPHYNHINAFFPTANYKLMATTTNHAARHRSMVTITQTKTTDAPLFSPHVVDDVSSSTSTAPTYVLNEDSTLKVTQSCLDQVERLLRQRREKAEQPENHDDGYFLRAYVDAGGCSGFQYQFEVDNELDEDEDVVVAMAKIGGGNDDDGSTIMRPRVVVDETSMGFLEGSTIDYVIEMIKSAFVVSDNPQSDSACGCGSSFAVKNFEKFGSND